MTPGQLADQIAARLTRLHADIASEVITAAGQVRGTEQGVTHKVSGRLARSETVVGYDVGEIVEVHVEPVDVPYAELEAERGGEHNFAERGLEASQAHIEQLRQNLEKVLTRVLEG